MKQGILGNNTTVLDGRGTLREAVVIIFSHLFGKLQVLLLPFPTLLKAPNTTVRRTLTHRRRPFASLPLLIPGLCCTPSEETSWPEGGDGKPGQTVYTHVHVHEHTSVTFTDML